MALVYFDKTLRDVRWERGEKKEYSDFLPNLNTENLSNETNPHFLASGTRWWPWGSASSPTWVTAWSSGVRRRFRRRMKPTTPFWERWVTWITTSLNKSELVWTRLNLSDLAGASSRPRSGWRVQSSAESQARDGGENLSEGRGAWAWPSTSYRQWRSRWQSCRQV